MVYFVADDEIAGPELWTSDGTAVGAYLVRDITAGATGTTIANLTAIGDLVYFSATTSARGAEPWCRALVQKSTLAAAILRRFSKIYAPVP
jgi:ELWxxDGT repeat protein